MDYENYAEMSVQQLGDTREYAINRLELVTEALQQKVKDEYTKGTSITKIAKQSNVTRATIYAWLLG